MSSTPSHAGRFLSYPPADEAFPSYPGRFPSWLHVVLPQQPISTTDQVLTNHREGHAGLSTVCEQARCPNLVECYSQGTATFLAMGSSCTRACSFCSIDYTARPNPLNPDEPLAIAQAAQRLALRHVVITHVARDDLADGGSNHLLEIMAALRRLSPAPTIELLTSDLQGCKVSLQQLLQAHPAVFNHNLETVRRLTPKIRHKATYEGSLALLRQARSYAAGRSRIKSGLMVGLGESDEEVHEALHDLYEAGVEMVTLGQYLRSHRYGTPVARFVPPETFAQYRTWAEQLGFCHIESAPKVRSSYHAQPLPASD